MPINYYDWFLCRYDENYHLARKYNLPIIAQAPVKGGLLLKKSNIPEGAFSEYSRSNLEAAYDFISQLEGIELILCGNSKLGTFKDTYQSLQTTTKIPYEKYENIIKIFVEEKATIQCLSCGRCDRACKNKIPIMAMIQLYNLGLRNKIYFNAFSIMKNSVKDPLRSCDSKCNECTEKCPFHYDFKNIFKNNLFELRT